MRNSYTLWTDDELELLRNMIQNQVPMRTMVKTLGRTQRAIQLAFQNMLYQQVLQHHPEEVAQSYHYEMDDLVESFVPPKYYQPLHDSPSEQPSSTSTSTSWFTAFITGFSAAACFVYYGYLLKQNTSLFI